MGVCVCVWVCVENGVSSTEMLTPRHTPHMLSLQ